MNKETISAAVKARIERFNRLYKEAVGYTFEEEVEVENQRYKREMEEYNNTTKLELLKRLKELGYDNEDEYIDHLDDIFESKGCLDHEDRDPIIQACWDKKPNSPAALYDYEKFVIDQAQDLANWIIDTYPGKEVEIWKSLAENKSSWDLIKVFKDLGYTGWKEGHSGNTGSSAVMFASTLIETPELFPYLHGALTPLVGDSGYHDNREDVHDAIENYKKTHPDFN